LPFTPLRPGRVGGLFFATVTHEGRGLLARRRRRHLAVAVVVLFVTVFGLVLLQPRHVRVEADGRTIDLSTLGTSDTAALRAAGVAVHPGDRVTALDGSGNVDVLRVERAHDVVVRVDGSEYRLRTHALTIDQLLAEAGVAVTGRDSVLQNGILVSMNAPVVPPRLFPTRGLGSDAGGESTITIDVRRAVTFSIVEDGRQFVSTSSRPTVAQALREAGVTIGPGDRVVPGEQAPLDADTSIEVTHAKAVTVTLPHDHQVIYTLEQTVGAALSSAGIQLPEGAFMDPPADTPVSAGMYVQVAQLSASSDTETEYVASQTVYRSDPSLAPGQTRTDPGHDGVRVRHYTVGYVNGVEASRTLVDESWDPEPVDTVIYYPTRTGRNDSAPSADSGTVTRTLNVYATWYNPASSGRSPSDPAYGHTATGDVVTYGIVAVDPDVIPLGTRMFIPGYGYAVAADTGGAIKGNLIDLGFPDGVTADWQSRWVEIYILS
jgi:uncharacterized protein YabE (DUF348 family)